MNVVVRTARDPLTAISGIQARVRELDRNLPVYRIGTMEQLLADSLAQRRLVMQLLAIVAGFALLLSAVGIYGVVSYAVSQRSAEIGIRILSQALRPVILGVAIGLPGAAAATRVLSSRRATRIDPMVALRYD
jgi:putative ABC transport system permease protein